MPQRDVHITPEGLVEVKKELEELVNVRRPYIAEKIKTAREFGDLSENFEYHSAKNEQGLLERRIKILRSRLHNAETVETATGIAGVGSHVEVEREDGERMTFEISSVGGVSPDSPVGRAIVGKSVGDEIVVEAPKGTWKAIVRALS